MPVRERAKDTCLSCVRPRCTRGGEAMAVMGDGRCAWKVDIAVFAMAEIAKLVIKCHHAVLDAPRRPGGMLMAPRTCPPKSPPPRGLLTIVRPARGKASDGEMRGVCTVCSEEHARPMPRRCHSTTVLLYAGSRMPRKGTARQLVLVSRWDPSSPRQARLWPTIGGFRRASGQGLTWRRLCRQRDARPRLPRTPALLITVVGWFCIIIIGKPVPR